MWKREKEKLEFINQYMETNREHCLFLCFGGFDLTDDLADFDEHPGTIVFYCF